MKCLNVFLLTQKYFPDHVNDSFKDGEGIPSVLLLFVTKCIFLHRIQYHVSRFEHQNTISHRETRNSMQVNTISHSETRNNMQVNTISHSETRNNIPNASTLITTSD